MLFSAKYFSYFLSCWVEQTAGETLLVGMFLGCTKNILWPVIVNPVREDCTNMGAPCLFHHSSKRTDELPPRILRKTFPKILPSLRVNISHEESSPKITCVTLLHLLKKTIIEPFLPSTHQKVSGKGPAFFVAFNFSDEVVFVSIDPCCKGQVIC